MSEITREQIEEIRLMSSKTKTICVVVPSDLLTAICDLAIKGLEADERARQSIQAALEAAATIADAWVTPEQRLSRSGGPAGMIRALIEKESQQ